MFSYMFWRFALERAVKTFAQTLVALLSASGIGLLNAPWEMSLSAAGMAALLSVLTSIASERVGDRGTPSLVPSDQHSQRSASTDPVPAPTAPPARSEVDAVLE